MEVDEYVPDAWTQERRHRALSVRKKKNRVTEKIKQRGKSG